MKFEPGKYYKHTGGGLIHTLGFLDTFLWGNHILISEEREGCLKPVGTRDKAYSVNWAEITKEEFEKTPQELKVVLKDSGDISQKQSCYCH